MTRVSVLIPFWNAAETLATALESVARQSIDDWECLMVDDGSIDASAEIASAFAQRDSRFRLLERAHAGLIPSLNAGIEACRGRFVARLDADDWMRRERLASQAGMLEADTALDAVGAGVRIFPRARLREGRRAYESWLNQLTDPQQIWRERYIECPVAHPTLMIRRERLAALRYRDRGWPEDYDLMLRLLRRGPVVGRTPGRLIGWRDHPDRLSRTDPLYGLDRFTACRAWHLHRDFLSGAQQYVLWGHGRTGRALRKALDALGHRPAAIVEVHPRRIGNTIAGAPVVPVDALENPTPYPLVVSVAGFGPRSEIRSKLASLGFIEGRHYVFAA